MAIKKMILSDGRLSKGTRVEMRIEEEYLCESFRSLRIGQDDQFNDYLLSSHSRRKDRNTYRKSLFELPGTSWVTISLPNPL